MLESARFHKILTLAVNPAAQDGEAQAAFGRLRELVRQNPQLTSPPTPSPVPVEAGDNTERWQLIKIQPFWFSITIHNLSGQAYDLGLRSKFVCDFTEIPTALDITCTGPKESLERFAQSLALLIDYINSQPANP